jgi:hypothetical protein
MENHILDKIKFRQTIMAFVNTCRALGLEDEDVLVRSNDVMLAYVDYVAREMEKLEVEEGV